MFISIAGLQRLLPTEPSVRLPAAVGHVYVLPWLSDQPAGRSHRVRPAWARRQVEEAGRASVGRGGANNAGQELSCHSLSLSHSNSRSTPSSTSLHTIYHLTLTFLTPHLLVADDFCKSVPTSLDQTIYRRYIKKCLSSSKHCTPRNSS